MTNLAIIAKNVLSAIALVWAGLAWFFVGRVEKRVSQLEQMHASPANGNGVKTISLLSRTTQGTQVAETDEAVLPADGYQQWAILGGAARGVSMFNQPNGENWTREQFDVEIPEGTTRIFATLQSIQLGYGRVVSDSQLRVEDHHFGFEGAMVNVLEVRRVSATIEVSMILRDDNADDRWTGVIGVNLLFLGKQATPEPIP
jgi:hypothetical protein